MEISQFTGIVVEAALRVSTGTVTSPVQNQGENLLPPPVSVIGIPTAPWATIVDQIEDPFAEDYDQEEYGSNLALTLMGYFELRSILRTLGISTLGQRDYNSQPLQGQKGFVVGTGPGREVVWYSAYGAEVTGLDATAKYLDITQRKVVQAQSALGRQLPVKALYQCPAESFDWPKEEYDFVSCLFGVLNHIESWKETLINICTSVKSCGQLFLSVYGPNEALVFRILEQLGYAPSILQRRAPGGILLGDSSELLPANFPLPEEISRVLTDLGFEDIKIRGELGLAALFPKDPTKVNIELFKARITREDPKLGEILSQITDPKEMLFRTYIYEQRNQRALTDYAYVRISGKKK